MDGGGGGIQPINQQGGGKGGKGVDGEEEEALVKSQPVRVTPPPFPQFLMISSGV